MEHEDKKKGFDWRSPLTAFIYSLAAVIIVSIIVGGLLANRGMDMFEDFQVEVIEGETDREGKANINIYLDSPYDHEEKTEQE